MTEKQFSSVTDQLQIVSESMTELKNELGKYTATLLLTLPVGIKYEDWVYLHKLKGDVK